MKRPALNFNDKSLKNFFLCSNQAMLVVDLSFQNVLEVNAAAEKLVGCNRDGFLTTPLQELVPQKEHHKLQPKQGQTAKEISLKATSGKIIFAEAAVSSISFDGKEALMITLADATEKKLYRQMLEDAIDEELSLKAKNKELKDLAYLNFHLVRKPLANILGLVNVLDGSVPSDKTLAEVLAFLKESGNELDGLIKNLDPQQY